MYKYIPLILTLIIFPGNAYGDIKIPLNLLSAQQDCVGYIVASDTKQGLALELHLYNLPPGLHGFHLHEYPSCESGVKDGKNVQGLAAGGHFDPDNTGRHAGPSGNGHLGDLPVITADQQGRADQTLYAPRLKVSDLYGHSLMIHAGGDNYSDVPQPLGGGGARLACGVVQCQPK